MKQSNLKNHRKQLIKNRQITVSDIEKNNELWESKVIFGSEDLMLASEFSGAVSTKVSDSMALTFTDFLYNSSAQSLGKFGEFLFAKFCEFKEIKFTSQHKGGVDFIIDSNIKVDVKAVRHLKINARDRFRRHNIEKQLPQVHYAYIIFWKNSVELRFELNDVSFGSYDCFFDSDLINKSWYEFDKKSIKFLDKQHVEITKSLKLELADWIEVNLGVKARVIQRKSTTTLGLRKGGWGADNFYQKPPHKHKLVVLLCVGNGAVSYIHSYPTSEYLSIEVRPKPVGTNRKEILCYDVSKLSDRYKFTDLNDFKLNVKQRFGF
jgi:hypothetical protein